MKIERSKEWWIARANAEENTVIGAGVPKSEDHRMSKNMNYSGAFGEPEKPESCHQCRSYWLEYQRISLLFERLAEDRFPDQEAFDTWMNAQMRQVFRSPPPSPGAG